MLPWFVKDTFYEEKNLLNKDLKMKREEQILNGFDQYIEQMMKIKTTLA
jgi:hypothetical protein